MVNAAAGGLEVNKFAASAPKKIAKQALGPKIDTAQMAIPVAGHTGDALVFIVARIKPSFATRK